MKYCCLAWVLAAAPALAAPITNQFNYHLISFTPVMEWVTHTEVPEWARLPGATSLSEYQVGILEFTNATYLISFRTVYFAQPPMPDYLFSWVDLSPFNPAGSPSDPTPEPSTTCAVIAAFVVMFRMNRGKRRTEWRKEHWSSS